VGQTARAPPNKRQQGVDSAFVGDLREIVPQKGKIPNFLVRRKAFFPSRTINSGLNGV